MKKITVFVLCILMVCGVFAGCGANNANTGTGKIKIALSLKTVHWTVFTSLRSAQSPSSPVTCLLVK